MTASIDDFAPAVRDLIHQMNFDLETYEPLADYDGISRDDMVLITADGNRLGDGTPIPLSPRQRKRLKWLYKEMERQDRKRLWSVDREARKNHSWNQPLTTFPCDGLYLIRDLLQSCFFCASKFKLQRPLAGTAEDAWATRTIVAGYRGSLRCAGPALSQRHLIVLLGLIKLAAGTSPDQPLHIVPRVFADEVLGWSQNGHIKKVVERVLEDLQSASVTRRWGNDETPSEVRFIANIERLKGGVVRITFDSSVLNIFRGHDRTYLSLERMATLNIGLQTWCYAFERSSDCTPANKFVARGGFTVAWFHELSGASRSMSLGEFRRRFDSALRKLQCLGLIEGSTIEGINVTIRKSGLTGRKEKRGKNSFWSTRAGKRILGEDAVPGEPMGCPTPGDMEELPAPMEHDEELPDSDDFETVGDEHEW